MVIAGLGRLKWLSGGPKAVISRRSGEGEGVEDQNGGNASLMSAAWTSDDARTHGKKEHQNGMERGR